MKNLIVAREKEKAELERDAEGIGAERPAGHVLELRGVETDTVFQADGYVLPVLSGVCTEESDKQPHLLERQPEQSSRELVARQSF